MHFIRRPETRPHAVFLSDYDMLLTEHLCRAWMSGSTPHGVPGGLRNQRHEVLVNEASIYRVGWLVAELTRLKSGGHWEMARNTARPQPGTLPKPKPLRSVERQVIPEFYTRGENGIPAAWVARMRESMARLTPAFAASRAVREYLEQHYLRCSRLP